MTLFVVVLATIFYQAAGRLASSVNANCIFLSLRPTPPRFPPFGKAGDTLRTVRFGCSGESQVEIDSSLVLDLRVTFVVCFVDFGKCGGHAREEVGSANSCESVNRARGGFRADCPEPGAQRGGHSRREVSACDLALRKTTARHPASRGRWQ